MERIWSTEIGARVGERVRLAGWLHRLRQLSNLSFLILRDAKGLAQIVVEDPALIERLAALHAETVLEVEGLVVAEPQAPGGVEIHQPSVEVLSAAVAPPPAAKVSMEPMGASMTGMRSARPRNVVVASIAETSRRTRGRNASESRPSRLRRSVVSVSVPPIR